MNQSERRIKNHTVFPNRKLVIDLEVRKNINNDNVLTQLAIHEVDKNILVDNYIVKAKGYTPHQHDQKIGLTQSELTNAKTIEEIDVAVRSHLRGSEIGFWNRESDLKIYPALLEYCEKAICLMKRYSSQYGPYNPEFGNRSFVSLVDAATHRGFIKDEGMHWHDARVDAAAAAYLWRWLDQQELPKAPLMEIEAKEIIKWDL